MATDKQCLQKMRKMVKDTHWIKGSLESMLDYDRDDDGQCKVDPDTGTYLAGKMGHCLMGLVGVVAKVDGISGQNDGYGNTTVQPIEYKLDEYPQAARITERLYKQIPDRFKNFEDEVPQGNELQYKAQRVESFNDSPTVDREHVIELIDRAIEDK